MENKTVDRKRRSSILKPTRSPTRNPLSEHNAENQEKRKSTGNKRVSFADKHEVTEFIRETSKDMDVALGILPNYLGSMLLDPCMPFTGLETGAQLVEMKENCPVAHVDLNMTMVTEYFHETMCDITQDKVISSEMKVDQQNHHNVTDNLLEDMSLTLTMSTLPPILCDPVAASHKLAEEKGFPDVNCFGVSHDSVEVWRGESLDKSSFAFGACDDTTTSKNGDGGRSKTGPLNPREFSSEPEKWNDVSVNNSIKLGVLELPRNEGLFSSKDLALDAVQDLELNSMYYAPEPSPLKIISNENVIETNRQYGFEMGEADMDITAASLAVGPCEEHHNMTEARTIFFDEPMEMTSFVHEEPMKPEKGRLSLPDQNTKYFNETIEEDSIACVSRNNFKRTHLEADNNDYLQAPVEEFVLPVLQCAKPNLNPETEKDLFLIEPRALSDDVQVCAEKSERELPFDPQDVVPSKSANEITSITSTDSIKPVLPTSLKIKSGKEATNLPLLARKMGLMKRQPISMQTETCTLKLKINPLSQSTSPKQLSQTVSTPEVIETDVFNPSECVQKADALDDILPSPALKETSASATPAKVVENVKPRGNTLGDILKAQKLLKSPSRIPVRTPTHKAVSTIPKLPDMVQGNESVRPKSVPSVEQVKTSDLPLESATVQQEELQVLNHGISKIAISMVADGLTPASSYLQPDVNADSSKPNRSTNNRNRLSPYKVPQGLSPNSRGKISPNVTPKADSLRVYTTPSKQRSVTRHSCLHSTEKDPKKRVITPVSAHAQPASKRSQTKSSARESSKLSSSAKHSVTPLSEGRNQRLKHVHVDDFDHFDLIENEHLPLLEGFSVTSQSGNFSNFQQSIKLDHGEDKPLNTVPKSVASNLASFDNIQPNADIAIKKTSIVSVHSSTILNTQCEGEKNESTSKLNAKCTELAPPDPKYLTVESVNQAASVVLADASGASPLLSTRKMDFFDTASKPVIQPASSTATLDPRKSLNEDFECDSPTNAYKVNEYREAEESKNYTFTRPNDKASFIVTPEIGLEEEIKRRMQSELVVEDWAYEVERLSLGLVRFTFGCEDFYLRVTFEEQTRSEDDDDAALGRKMSQIKVFFTFPDTAFPENAVSMKILKTHMKVDFEDYKYSSALPELLEKLTDPFFRCRTLWRDLYALRAYLISPLTCTDEGTEVQARLISPRVMAVVVLSFTIRFDTYPFAAVRPHFIAKSPEAMEVRSGMLEAMMEEKTGELYLWRMFVAARSVLRKREQKITKDELKSRHSHYFYNPSED